MLEYEGLILLEPRLPEHSLPRTYLAVASEKMGDADHLLKLKKIPSVPNRALKVGLDRSAKATIRIATGRVI